MARAVVIVGGGAAGLSAALAASALGARTTVVDSKGIGLSRALLPLLLSGRLAEGDLVLPQARELARAGVEVLAGQRVTSVQHEERKILLDPSSSGRGGASRGFDSLVICTGAAGQPPALRGLSNPNVFVLSDPTDYLRLSAALGTLGSVVVSGPVPLALKLAEILAMKGKNVQVYCGRGGLEHQFSEPVADAIRKRAAASPSLHPGAGAVSLVDGPVDSILGMDRAEAVVSDGDVRTCDAVVVVPRSVPSFPEVGCRKGRGGGLLVDASMMTNLPGIFAAGDSAEISFKSGSIPARLYSTSVMGGEVAGTNAAGGRASASPSWSVEQTYFGLEFCSAGLGEEDAIALGLHAATEATGSVDSRSSRVGGGEQTGMVVSMVYDTSSHQVYGLAAAGSRASSLSGAASMIVSLGLSAEQLVHMEFPSSPTLDYEASPIALTARKIAQSRRG